MAELRVFTVVTLDGEIWEHTHQVTVPPDYKRQDIEPFIRHEMDKAVATFQREEFGEARSAEIIRQYDRRIGLILALLRRAPHDVRNRSIVQRIRDIIDMDRGELYARFGDESVRD